MCRLYIYIYIYIYIFYLINMYLLNLLRADIIMLLDMLLFVSINILFALI